MFSERSERHRGRPPPDDIDRSIRKRTKLNSARKFKNRPPMKSRTSSHAILHATETLRARNQQRVTPAGGYGLQDGGRVIKVSNIGPDVSWSDVKEALQSALEDPEAVAYTTLVSEGECFSLLKPFTNEEEILSAIKIPQGSVRVLDGLELAAAVKELPAHIQRLRERRATEQAAQRHPYEALPSFLVEALAGLRDQK